ncbi:MAG: 1-acyl-sn-glycerol-3-phosphate acyltransferase, partial [Nostoc sp.]
YHQKLADAKTVEIGHRNEALAVRLQALLNAALQISEQYFDLQSKGSLRDRCQRVEQAGWNYIFREDFKDAKGVSAVEKALGDRVAEEANARMWHMRL